MTAARTAARPAGWSWAAARRPLGLFVASRIVVLVVVQGVIASGHGYVATRFAGPWPALPPAHLQVLALSAWDGSWYTAVARHGYSGVAGGATTPDNSFTAFFPLYPLLVRGAADVVHANILDVVTFAIGALASVALWLLVRDLTDPAVADRTVALWCFWPGAFVLSLSYSEGLTVLLAATCLRALLRRRWLVAGLAAGVATAAAPTDLALVVCCAWGGVAGARAARSWRPLLAPLLSPAGAACFFGYLWSVTGDPLFWYHSERTHWQQGHSAVDGLRTNTVDAVRAVLGHPSADAVVLTAGLVAAAAALVLLVRWRPPATCTLLCLVVFASALVSGPVGLRPRFFLVAFPALAALARRVGGPAFLAVLATSAALLAVVTVITLTGTPFLPP